MNHKFVLYVKKSAENGQLTMKVIKKWSLWAISRKAPYRIFSNMPFWKAPRVPRNTSSLVFLLHSFWKTCPKKPPCTKSLISQLLSGIFQKQIVCRHANFDEFHFCQQIARKSSKSTQKSC
jgi:hypothetical protein